MYPVDSFERKLIEEHWGKNKSLKFITNCCSDIFPEKNVGDINDTWDGIVKTVTKKYELR